MQRIRNKGFTMVEAVVGIAIFTLLLFGIAALLINGLRSNAVLWEQLATQSDGRKVLREVVDVVRRVESSSVGSYAVETALTDELTVYANVDADTYRERVRFWLDDTVNILYKGVIKPSGNPLTYSSGNEVVTVLARDVVNGDQGQPVFTYFDESYTGNPTSTPLSHPFGVTEVRVVRVQLELEEDPNATPVPLHVESTVHIRNLKQE